MTLSRKCISVSQAVTERVFQKQILGNGFDTLRPAKKHIFAVIETACCFSKGACCCVVVFRPGRVTEMKLSHLPLKILRGCCDVSYRMRESMWRTADVCVLSPRILGENQNDAALFACETQDVAANALFLGKYEHIPIM